MHDALLAAGAHLFKPHDAVRTPPDLFADFWGSLGGKNYHVTIGQNATFYLEEAETGHQTKRVIDAGSDLIPGVRVTYWLKSRPESPVVLTFVDDKTGAAVISFTSDIPEDKDDRIGLYCTADEGMNSFQWPMRYPQGLKMDDTDYHGPPKGPLVPPGRYRVQLTVGGDTFSETFELLRHPLVDTSDEAFAEQRDLLLAIRNKGTEVVAAVNTIRRMRKQLTAAGERAGATDAHREAIGAVAEKLGSIENELVNPELTSAGDSLNHPPRLFETLMDLEPVVSSADTRPTAASYSVFNKLSSLIDPQLAALESTVASDVDDLNRQLGAAGISIIGA